MDLIKEYKEKSTFKNEKDILESLSHIFMLGEVKSEYKRNQTISNKEAINSLIIRLLEEILSDDLITNKKDKLTVINLLDELNYRNEILELIASQKGYKEKEIKEISERLGNKFISSLNK